LTEVVNSKLSISSNITKVTAQHSEWPGGGKESIAPVCLALDPVITVNPKADVSITKSVTPTNGTIGDLFTYTLIYRNLGGLATLNTAIADIASPVGRLNSYTITKQPNHGSCSTNSNGITCGLGTLPVGASGTIKYTARAVVVGVVDNTAVINTSTPETDLTNNSDDAIVNISSTPTSATCDAFSASPVAISSGIFSTLSWTTTNATSVTIDHGIGSVADDGSTTVSPTSDTTYTLIATGTGGSDTCTAFVTVSSTPLADVTITKSVTPSSGLIGQVFTYTLTYRNLGNLTTENTAIADIASPIGKLSSYSITKQPEHGSCNTTSNGITCGLGTLPLGAVGTITYTAVGVAIGTIENTAVINTSTPETDLTNNQDDAVVVVSGGVTSATCDAFSASPSVILSGGSSTLSWSTTNATSVSIDNSIGSVADDGSMSVSPTANIIYILTALGTGGNDTCNTSITISSTPLADVAITKSVTPATSLKGGFFTYTLNYSNLGSLDAVDTKIEDKGVPIGVIDTYTITSGPDHGACSTNSDGISCDLGTLPIGAIGSIEYKATAREIGIVDNIAEITTTTTEVTLANNKDSASVSVFTNGTPPCTINCGGGLNPPTVIMLSKPGDDRPFASQSFIYLSQIPYTGVATNFKGALFVIFLSLWSAVLAYFIIRRWNRPQFAGVPAEDSPRSFREEEKAVKISDVIKERYSHIPASALEPEIKRGTSFAGNNLPVGESKEQSVQTINPKIEIVKSLSLHARERGALVSDDALDVLKIAKVTGLGHGEELLNSIVSIAGTMYPKDDGWLILDRKRIENVLFSSRLTVVSIFTEWLSQGDSKKVFSFLRVLRIHKISVKSFLKKVAYYIDHLYRCRIGESLEGAEYKAIDLENQCTNWSTKNIQQIVGILVDGVDESYESEDASVKLALVKVLEISERAKVEGKSYYN